MVRAFLAAGLIQYTAVTAPVSVPTPPPDTPEQADHWAPVYVHKVYPKPRTIEYQPRWVGPTFISGDTVTPEPGQAIYPDRIPRRVLPIAAHRALSEPPFQPPDTTTSGGQFIATGSIKALLQYQALASPMHQETLPAPADISIIGRQAERTWRARALSTAQHLTWASDKFTAPTAATTPELVQPVISVPILRVYRRATFGMTEPLFGYVDQTPVMSWTGQYLTPPMRKRVRYQPDVRPFALDFDTTINPAAPLFSWDPEYPTQRLERPKSRIHLYAARTDALHVPDVTNPVTVLSWQGHYAERVWPKRGLRAALQQAWAFDRYTAPAAPTVPDLAQPVFADRVPARRPVTPHPAHLAPYLVPDVTQPVGAIEWLAIYPDRIDRDQLPVYAKLSYTGVVFIAEFIPAAVVHEIEGRGSYVRKIYGRGSYDPSRGGRGSL